MIRSSKKILNILNVVDGGNVWQWRLKVKTDVSEKVRTNEILTKELVNFV